MGRAPADVKVRFGREYRGGNLYATIEQVQAVWGYVTNNPRATLDDMKHDLRISRSRVFHILKFLEGCGYIEHTPGKTGRKVLMPLMEQSS